jgi:hypothetical protein
MKVSKHIHDPEWIDKEMQIESLLSSYNFDEIARHHYMQMMDEKGVDFALESLIRDLPDGFAQGRLRLKDINKRLNQLGC